MKMSEDFSALEERQAMNILRGISQISAELGTLAQTLDAETPATDRASTASAMLDLLDRLANLEFLERMHLDNDLGDRCTGFVKKGLDDANTCLTCSAIKLILARAATIRDHALAIVAGNGEYTLGLSQHLASVVDDIDFVVGALGHGAAIEGIDLGVIEVARRAVAELARGEQRVLALPEFT